MSGHPVPAVPPRTERLDPFSGGSPDRPVGLMALQAELGRAMAELGKKADPPPYFISYEVFDREETIVSASYGALVQSSSRRTPYLSA